MGDEDRLLKISYSSISTYFRCPRQYYHRYILGEKEPPGIALIEGSAHHSALEYNNLHKKSKGRDLKASVVTEKFVEEFRQNVLEKEVKYEDESEDAIIERGKIWHKKYMKEMAPFIEPNLVEEEFKQEVTLGEDNILFHGIVDLTHNGVITEYKTTSAFRLNTYHKPTMESDLQLSLGAWLTNSNVVEKICFVKGNVPYVIKLESKRTNKQIQWALKVAEGIVGAIKLQSFPYCSPDLWQCSPKWCGYWKNCRGKLEG